MSRGVLRTILGPLVAVAIAGSFLLSPLSFLGGFAVPGGFSAAPTPHAIGVERSAVAAVNSNAAPAATQGGRSPDVRANGLGNVSSGPGLFFNNQEQPAVPSANYPCPKSYYTTAPCINDTNEPSLNYTTTGWLDVAYTAYTNAGPCTSLSAANTTTLIAFSRSSNFGQTWSAPTYFGNPICTGGDAVYQNAAQPSLTSLPNGSLVITYEEYNYTPYQYNYYQYSPPYFVCSYLYNDRVVVSRSFNNGTTWTTPVPLDTTNSSSSGSKCGSVTEYPDMQPRIAAFGSTVYVAWSNLTQISPCGPSGAAHLRVSTDDAVTWGTAITVKAFGSADANCGSTVYHTAFDPVIAVEPSGAIDIAYVTAVGGATTGIYKYTESNASIELARSTTNGSAFSYSLISNRAFLANRCCTSNTFDDPVPSIAYGASTHQIFVAWASGNFGFWCYNYGTYKYCGNYQMEESLTVANSSTAGSSWAVHPLVTSLIDGQNTSYAAMYNPSISVTPNGVLHLATTYYNDSVCIPSTYYYGVSCGENVELYMNSTNNGTTFSQPGNISPYWTVPSYDSNDINTVWDGEYSSMITVGHLLVIGWTSTSCASTGLCYSPTSSATYGPGETAVFVSAQTPPGSGLTLTFTEKGLPTGDIWSISVMGNIRSAAAPTSLSVSDVPKGSSLWFTLNSVPINWGAEWTGSSATTPPAAFTKNATISVTYVEMVLLTITSTPLFPAQCWSTNLGLCSNYQLSPVPGPSWIPAGTATTLSATDIGFKNYAFDAANLGFVSWTGSGVGNVSSTSATVTVSPKGPINESANFDEYGFCTYASYYTPALTCFNETYFPLTFVQTGLPKNVAWSATIVGQNGAETTQSTSAKSLAFQIPANATQFFLWTVPDSAASKVWIPTPDVPSPVAPAANTLVDVHFSLGAASTASFPSRFVEHGLPNGTAWSFSVGGTSYGAQANNTTLPITGGGPTAINGSTVYLNDGVGYYAANLSYDPWVQNATPSTKIVPASINVQGPATYTVNYSAMYLVTVAASRGGTVGPATGWHIAGSTIALTAKPSPGYHFVGWTGGGSGATTSADEYELDPTITSNGPISEFATFRPNPAPTWNLTVTENGLPIGTAFTISIGTQAYSGVGTFHLARIVNGSYVVTTPTVYLNSSQSTEFLTTSLVTPYATEAGGELGIFSNGTISVSYATRYLVELAATPAEGGTLTPAAGAYWMVPGSDLNVSATPNALYQFDGWNSSFSGIASSQPTFSVTVGRPIALTARFELRPIGPPDTFTLAVTETGLPAGLVWNVSLGAHGASGAATRIVVDGLNGSYAVTVASVADGYGVRYVADVPTPSRTVTTNSTMTVSFTLQYLLALSVGVGGTISPSGDDWVAPGTAVPITATANASYVFVGWTGGENVTTPTTSVTVDRPIAEAAVFAPVYGKPTPSQSGTAASGMPIALGVLVGLLVVGLAVGFLIARRLGRPPRPEPIEPWSGPTSYEPTVAAPEYLETPDTVEDPPDGSER